MALEAMNSPTTNSWPKTFQEKNPKRSDSPQPVSEEEYLALCLVMLARSGTVAIKETAPKDPIPAPFKCSVCNKGFTSHQALGGHKASHSKPNSAAVTDKPSTSAAATGRSHECSICHKKFPSGQALGGHKRRHYEGQIGGNHSSTSNSGQNSQSQSRGGDGLGFDLNMLPEMESDEAEENGEELESRVASKKQRLLGEEGIHDHRE